ncbi:MAG: CinA family protein [Candidatus Hodarchaeales archaeon]|jgi:nicotinamide-nucleotide amidase
MTHSNITISNDNLETKLADLLINKKLTISVAESCTGGLVSHRLTNIPGSSKYFLLGVVVYSNLSKMQIINIRKETLSKFGAESEVVAKQLAEGVQSLINSDIGVGITGLAGPTGGTLEKPIGLVYIGVATKKQTFVKEYLFQGSREQNKINFSDTALNLILDIINEEY